MNFETQLQEKIYLAQCYGTIEPIEYMVPYPNLGSLVEGQNIKLADKTWYTPHDITYGQLLNRIRKTANWLLDHGIGNNDYVLLLNCPSPEAEILAYAVWTLGAIVVLAGDDDPEGVLAAIKPKLIVGEADENFENLEIIAVGADLKAYPGAAGNYPIELGTRWQAALDQDALVFWQSGRGIRLSHYNLLVNANGVRIVMETDNYDSLRINLPTNSTAWVILQTLLPVYTGIEWDPEEGLLTIGYPRQYENMDFLINFRWWKPLNQEIPELTIVPEATAVILIDEDIVPMLEVDRCETGSLCLSGHTVMQGYLDDHSNAQVFTNGWLKLSVPGE